MNVNIKLSITDAERNLIARKLDGKNVKRMVTRKEVNELVAGFMEGLLADIEDEFVENYPDNPGYDNVQLAAPDLSSVPRKYQDKPVQWQVGWLRGWNAAAPRKSR